MKSFWLRASWVLGLIIPCAGFSTASAADTNPPPCLTLELHDSSRVVGQSVEKNFKFHSALLGDLKLAVKEIRMIDCVSSNLANLTMTNGDRLSGWFVDPQLRVSASFGKVEIPVGSIRKMTVTMASLKGQRRAGLVASWSGEGKGNDSIGSNNAILTDITFVEGKVGQAFSLDGVSGYISIPDSPSLDSLTNSITIELWMKAGQLTRNADWKGLVTKGNSSWWVQATANAKTVYMALKGVSPIDMYGARNVNDGQWHHVAAVYDGTKMSLYVDGTVDVSQPATGSIAQNSDPVCLGANSKAFVPSCACNQLGYFFNGLIDEVSLYNRALSAEEIQADYDAGNSRN